MNYPFPEIKRTIYKRTFLKDVQLYFNFICSNDFDFNSLSQFFNDKFKLKINKEELENGVWVESDNKLVKFGFSPKDVRLKLFFPAYRNFDFVFIWLPIIIEYLKILKIDYIDSLSIRKYNQLDFSFNPGTANIAMVMKEIFSKQLLDAKWADNEGGKTFDEEALSFTGLGKWERNLFFTEENSIFRIEFGFSTSENSQDKGILTLKTIIETKGCKTSLQDLNGTLMALNHVLDRGFRWCVTDSIINQMEQDDEKRI